MSIYDIWEANCQNFVLSLLDGALVRMGNRSTFVGTIIQIVDWDSRNRNEESSYDNIDKGFYVHPPRPGSLAWTNYTPLHPACYSINTFFAISALAGSGED